MGIFFQLYLKPASADPTIIMLRVVLLLAAFVAFASAGFPADARNMILSEHNKYRKETGAAGMKYLVWDAELEAYAEKMAGECKYRHEPAQKYGENIYWASNEQTAVEAAEGASKAWYSEKAVVDAEWGCYHGKTAKTCGHFSQQVWKNTKKIGCFYKYCDAADAAPKGSYLFCEYSPAGNSAVWDYDSWSIKWPAPY